MSYILRIVFFILLSFLCLNIVYAQKDTLVKPNRIAIGADTLIKKDTTQIKKSNSSIQSTIKYTAKDSIVLSVVDETAYLYGNADVTYTDINLKADQIEINWKTNLVIATGRPDSTGKLRGIPVFKQGSDTYVADTIKYNFKSRKGIITNVATQQGEGYIQGSKIKKSPDNELYIKDAIYTTCNLKNPHFCIRAHKIKVIPEKQIISGPFNLEIANIPMPIGFLFGMFPQPKTNTSGIVIPIYGESRENGFFLRQGGYHWAASDHLGVTLLGEIYTKGNWGLNLSTAYKTIYHFDGNARIRYNVIYNGDEGYRSQQKDFWVEWTHTPVPRGTSRFSASVNGGSSTFNANNSFVLQNRLSNNFQSTITYSKAFRNTPFNLTVSARHNQEVQKKVVNITFPAMNFSMNRVYPFKKKGQSPKGIIQNINLSYNLDAAANISNQPRSGALGFTLAEEKQDSIFPFSSANLPRLLNNVDMSVKHRIPITTTVKFLKYFSGNLSVNYNEIWYREKYDFNWNEQKKAVDVDTIPQFGRTYDASATASLTTRIYGTFYLKKGKIQAIRHLITPNLGFSYTPDFSTPVFGFFKEIQIDASGTRRKVPLYTSSAGSPTTGKAGSISFGLSNALEMKLRPKSDTVTKAEKISLLDNLSASGSYNILADSFNLSNLNLQARTRILNNIDINLSSVIDPYTYERSVPNGVETFKRTKTYAWNGGQRLGTLTNASAAVALSLNPNTFSKNKKNPTDKTQDLNPLKDPLATPTVDRPYQNNADRYVDFDIPWNLSTSYNIYYTKFSTQKITQTLSFSGDVSITEKWKIGFTSGYDIKLKKLTPTSINLYRDLHCWEMRFNWIPFGQWQSYSFSLSVKASMLRDALKLNRNKTWYDNR